MLFIARTNGSVVLFGDTESAGIFAADVLVFYRDAGVGGVIGSKRGGRRRCDRSYLVVVYRLNNKKSGWFPSGFFVDIAGEANDWRSRPFDGGITYAGRNSNIPRLSCDSSGMSV